MRQNARTFVMAGLVPAIHVFDHRRRFVDARDCAPGMTINVWLALAQSVPAEKVDPING
jgi:hypothetical protein